MNVSLKHTNDYLTMVSYNLHGINELISRYDVYNMLIQEHWLTPENLCKLSCFTEYCFFGISAMSNAVSGGILYGRPFGGLPLL